MSGTQSINELNVNGFFFNVTTDRNVKFSVIFRDRKQCLHLEVVFRKLLN